MVAFRYLPISYVPTRFTHISEITGIKVLFKKKGIKVTSVVCNDYVNPF